MAFSAPSSPTTSTKPTDWNRLALLVLFTVALGLRLWNIGWGLPNTQRAFSYHPDESIVVGADLSINPFLLRLDPHFYNYGSLSLLLQSGAIHLGEMVGFVGPGPAPGIPSAGALLLARLVTVLMGVATCGLLYGAGRRLFGTPIAGLTSAGLYAIAPLAVQHGHWATVDVPATFWITGALLFAARAVTPEGKTSDLLWCGIWSGLAAATKYNAGLVVLSGVAAWWLTRRAQPRALFALLGGTVGAFLLGCPTLLLKPRDVFKAILEESRHVATGHGEIFTNTPSGFIYHIGFNLNWGLTWPLLIVVLVGMGYAAIRRQQSDGILAAFALPYYVLIGLAAVKFARYTLPLFPPLFLWAGALIPPATQKRAAYTVAASVGAASVFALLFTLALDQTMGGPDPRDEAAAFLKERSVPSVGFAAGPWYYSPPLNPLFCAPRPKIAQEAAVASASPRLFPAGRIEGDGSVTPIEWDLSLLRAYNPDAVPVSEFEYADAQRIGQANAKTYLSALASDYKEQHVFAHPVKGFGMFFTNLSTKRGLPTQNMPHDMLYTNPTVVVFLK